MGEEIMNIDLIKMLLVIACASSILSTAFVQKIKTASIIKCNSCLLYISFFISMLFGVVFTLSFTKYDILESLWVGLFSFLGADSLYKAFEDKIFASYSKAQDVRALAKVLGESDLGELDRKYLKFAEKFEESFLKQEADERRNINQTLDLALEILNILPKEELNKL